MQKKPLEITCYVAGAGAFGVFFRWLQDQLAFDEAGLNEKSVFNLLVPLVAIASILLFRSFLRGMKEQKLTIADDYCQALFNPGKLFALLRVLAGLVMAAGGVLLFLETETDPNVKVIRVIAVLAILSGLSFPLILGAANYEYLPQELLVRIGQMLPVLMYAVWLLLCYLANAFNSVPWSYAVEVFAVIAAMMAFFRVGGFAFHVPDGFRALFAVMVGAMLCIMALADERYTGFQLIFLSSAGMLLLYEWALVRNMKKKGSETHREGDREVDNGGFEVVK